MMLVVTSWLMLTTITKENGEKICFAVVGENFMDNFLYYFIFIGGIILSMCGFVVGLGKNCKEKRSQECFTKAGFQKKVREIY